MNEDRTHEMVEHLQAAAMELIAAARVMLDMAEDVVKDPAQALELASLVAHMGQQGQGSHGHHDHQRVQHIRVS